MSASILTPREVQVVRLIAAGAAGAAVMRAVELRVVPWTDMIPRE